MKIDDRNSLDCPPPEAIYDDQLARGDRDPCFDLIQPELAETLRLLHEALRFVPISGGIDPESEKASSWPALPPRFEILSEVGRGGFGVVYHSFDKVLQRDVAIKVPHAPLRSIDELR